MISDQVVGEMLLQIFSNVNYGLYKPRIIHLAYNLHKIGLKQ